ncbi:MAG TPA: tetratricopeptide repeat protein [Polyangia bacterium]|jgi:hypothetical protein|nr:tetratricopeptide repeat protein [Polyangia bacterium]
MRLTSLPVRAGSLAVLLSLFAGPAAADDPRRAKELFQEGTTFFDVGQFDKAIEAWQAGYKAKPDPGFLYNIAQAYRISGDPHKAIFFYRGYLRNSPNAENRVEVEQKIATLQKQAAELDKNKQPALAVPAPPPPGRAAVTAPPPAPTSVPPPPSSAPTPAASTPHATKAPDPPPASSVAFAGSPTAPSEPSAAVGISTVPEPPGPSEGGGWDLGAVLGADTWQTGFSGQAQPSFAMVFSGGYTLGGSPERRALFRIGAVVGYTFLSERMSRTAFWSWLVEPMLRYRVSENWTLSGAFGIGVLAVSGMKSTSVLLAAPTMPTTVLTVNGTQSLLEIRPALGAEYRLTHSLGVLLSLGFPYSPKKQNFYGPIRRSELLIGLGYHL